MSKKLISFVLPVYNEEEGLDEFWRVLDIETRRAGVVDKYDFEFVFINDGSRDRSLEMLRAMHAKDPRVKVISFSRNFGHQIAITAGLDFAQGAAVIIIDCDLQDPPSVAIEMLSKWEEGYQVVYGQRRSRKDSLFKRTTAAAFYWLIDRLTDFAIPKNTGDFRLMDRAVVDTINRFRERNRFMRGMVSFVGFRQFALQFDRDERYAGVTHYPFRKMVKLALDGIFSFSTAPLKAITRFGLFLSLVSFICIVYVIAMYFLRPDITVPGWSFMMVSILFMGGVQIIILGVLGEYIGRIYAEVQQRPLYIVDETLV